MTKKDLHVVPRDSGWAVQKEGGQKATSLHRTQTEATSAAREQAIREKVEVVIHRPTGQIRNSNSYGKDPNPPKDKK
jgi:hypothetical protein